MPLLWEAIDGETGGIALSGRDRVTYIGCGASTPICRFEQCRKRVHRYTRCKTSDAIGLPQCRWDGS